MTAARDAEDRVAFAQVVDRCHRLVRLTVLRDTADPELSDEIAQEVFVRAWAKRHLYRPGTSPRAWLLAIARSQVLEHHRHRDRARRHLKRLVAVELLRRRQDDADELHEDRLEALRICMGELQPAHRELLDLVHGQGLSTEDAALVLDIKPPACRKRLSRLQQALRNCIETRLQGEEAS
jgi:RNA polymerase sigma-70 factor, ECF subfamily